jgi:hypothetical protein
MFPFLLRLYLPKNKSCTEYLLCRDISISEASEICIEKVLIELDTLFQKSLLWTWLVICLSIVSCPQWCVVYLFSSCSPVSSKYRSRWYRYGQHPDFTDPRVDSCSTPPDMVHPMSISLIKINKDLLFIMTRTTPFILKSQFHQCSPGTNRMSGNAGVGLVVWRRTIVGPLWRSSLEAAALTKSVRFKWATSSSSRMTTLRWEDPLRPRSDHLRPWRTLPSG